MDPKDPTPAADNHADDPSNAGTPDGTDPNAAGDGTGADANNPTNPSKSDDTTVADGDKKPTGDDNGASDGTPAPLQLDSDLDDWAKKRGFPEATDDATKQAYQAARNEQREFTRQQQAAKSGKDASDLDAATKEAKDKLKPTDGDEPDDPLEKTVKELKEERDQERDLRLKGEIYAREQVTTAEHEQIKTIFMEKVDKAGTDEEKLKALDFWGSPAQLGDLLDIARSRIAKGVDNSADLDAAAREERERIAKESNASSPGRSAKTPPTTDKTPEQERTERLKARYS